MRPRAVIVRNALLASAVLGLGAVLLWPERIRWTGAGAAIVAHDLLPGPVPERLAIAPTATIIAEGDSLIAGSRGKDAGLPWPARLEQRLGGPKVVNRGRGGATASEGAAGWRDAPCGDVAIILYGANDASVRGWIGGSKGVPLANYRQALGRIVARHRACGAAVVVLAPLPPGSTAMEDRLAPYRAAARAVAREQGALFADPQPALAECTAPLQRDGLHLSDEGRAALAAFVAARLRVTPSS